MVKRSREDFKWLVKKLKEEIPSVKVVEIDKGQLSKRIIEDFFDSLISNKKALNSRYLRYFLSAADDTFKSRKLRVRNPITPRNQTGSKP
jgi:hypothetical protein